jgi:predicted outer membrane repeat protein
MTRTMINDGVIHHGTSANKMMIIPIFLLLLVTHGSNGMVTGSQLRQQIDTIHFDAHVALSLPTAITVDGLNGNDNECIIDPINVACQTLNGAQRVIGDSRDDIVVSLIGPFTYPIESTGLLFQHSIIIKKHDNSSAGSVIIDCSAVIPSSAACLASHLSLTVTGIMVTGSLFVNIIQLSSMGSVLTLTNMIFFNLTFHRTTKDATMCGAIRMNSSSTFVMINTIFDSIAYELDYAEGRGFITIPGSSNVTIMGSIFTNISVIGNNELITIGSTNLPSIVSMTNCWFDHNQGTIRITSHGLFPFANVLIVNTTLRNQLCLPESSSCADIAALQLFTTNVTITASTFFNVRDLIWKPTTHAAIVIVDCDFMNSNYKEGLMSSFLNFRVEYELIRTWITIYSSYFNGADGGAIRLSSYSSSVVTLTIANCSFHSNDIDHFNGGGAISVHGSNTNTSIMFTQFINNRADVNGGAIEMNPVGQITMENCIFIDNYALFGGAFSVIGQGEQHRFQRCLFLRNRSGYGGALNIVFTLRISISTMICDSNYASHSGGGCMYIASSMIEFDNVLFINNSALYNGGAVSSSDSRLIGSYQMINNHADKYGGAIYATTSQIDITGMMLMIKNDAKSGDHSYYLSPWNILL